jgi:competence ComEA-like helix-hairpin-helix protein
MANIPLRSYIREIEGLIDSGQLEETVAHCRYILQTFPKHIDTYRLLGKVFLEGRQFTNASDIFYRVLSAVPDDFVSHVGMSIIREDEGNLDAAIWHMERAFESQPSNKAIQDELRRLFGRRDGVEPHKIRLTRGALARMYAKGNLYDQATAELRGALSEDPHRADLQLLLAHMNYLAGNRVEAVETSSNILKKFPYCLMANRILALILPHTERASDAKVYLQRAFALDPYLEKAGLEALTSEDVPDSAIMLEPLERKPGQPIEGMPEQPAWAATLGIKFDGSGDEELPDWLAEDMVIPSYEGEQIAPFIEEDVVEKSTTEGEVSEELIPEWMKDAGWHPSLDESDRPLPGEDIDVIPDTEIEIERAEIPDWLKEIPGVEALEESTTVDKISEDAIPPWLDITTPGPTDSIISWLEEKDEASKAIETEESYGPEEDLENIESLQAIDAAEAIQEDIAEMPAPSIEGMEETEEQDNEADELPEWLREPADMVGAIPSETENSIESVSSETVEAGLEWLEELEGQQAEESIGTDDWIDTIETESPSEPDLDKVSEEEVEKSESLMEDISVAEPIEIPEWLKNLDEVTEGEQLFDEVLPEKTDIPEWLQELGEISEGENLIDESVPEIKPESEIEPDETIASDISLEQENIPEQSEEIISEKQDDALAWLEGLAAKQGVSEEELITKPEERRDTPPDWVIEEESRNELQAEKELIEGESSTEDQVPDWLQEAEEMKEDPTFEPGDDTIETPAWIHELEIGEQDSLEPSDKDLTEDTHELSKEDAGLAWLESLAAKQGVSEEELITRPEDRVIEPPPWVQEEVEYLESHADLSIEEVPVQDDQIEVTEDYEKEGWGPENFGQSIFVDEMREISPEITDENEIKVDLNTGSLTELERIPGIGFVLAQSILEYRDEHGQFNNIDDLKDIPGIDDISYESIKDHFTIQKPELVASVDEIESVPEGFDNEQLVIAQSALNTGDIDRAIEAYEQLIKQSQKLDEIITILEEEVSKNPENILLLQTLGDAYMRDDQFQKAIEAYTKAEKLL